MTLRARLTAAFLAVVLGPVLLGAIFVGTTTSVVMRQRANDRLALGAIAMDNALDGICHRLRAAATAAAALAAAANVTGVPATGTPGRGTGAPAAQRSIATVVEQAMAGAVRVDYVDGRSVSTADPWPEPVADCAATASTPESGRPYQAITAQVELRDPDGRTIGRALAADLLDLAALRRLAGAGGVAVTMLDARGGVALSTAERAVARAVAAAVAGPLTGVPATGVPATRSGTEVPATGVPGGPPSSPRPGGAASPGGTGSRTGPASPTASGAPSGPASPGGSAQRIGSTGPDGWSQRSYRRGAVTTGAPHPQYAQLLRMRDGRPPLLLVLAVPYRDGQEFYLLLLAIVTVTGLSAVVVAWWLARTTTRPLAELRATVGRIAERDLTARVPVRGRDEIGWLAVTVNRMARETQAYVQALTTSRDQLRDRLGALGATLSSTHNMQEILPLILRSAMTATGAQAGMVLIVDAEQGVLVGRCGEGLVERGQPDPLRLRILVGDGLLGTVAATGQPRRGVVGGGGPRLSPHEPRCHSYLAVPFSAPAPMPMPMPMPPDGPGQVPARGASHQPPSAQAGAIPVPRGAVGAGGASPLDAPRVPPVQGVLVLYDRLGGDEFDDADVATLATFAGHAAVAVENVRVHEETRRQSLTDPLTGLRNYRFLTEQLNTEVERATRFNRPLCVLALDLDRFKEVNDTFGHAAGDAVLAEFARRIRGEIREVDAAFRQGGEEFVILLPDTDQAGGVIVAERLGTVVRSAPMTITSTRQGGTGPEPQHVPVTVSIGVALFPVHAATGPQLLESADNALYAAKAAGRDTFRVAAGTGAVPGVTEPPAPRSAPLGAARPGAPVPLRTGPTGTDDQPLDGSGGASGGASSGLDPPRRTHGR